MSIVPNYIPSTNSGKFARWSAHGASYSSYAKDAEQYCLTTITLSTDPNSTYASYKTDLGDLKGIYDAYYNNYITAPKLLLDPDTTGKYDTIDNSGNLLYKWDPLMRPNPNLNDALSADTQTLLVQQNTMYIIGIITCITLIITAIMLSSSR